MMADRGDLPSRSLSESEGDFGQTKRRGGGGKLSRSETVTVRLDPKLRYLAELAARKQRRTLSSFIEWAIEETLQNVNLLGDGAASRSVASEASELWDVDEPDRFIKLALSYPDMLTHEEQILWKLVQDNGYLWLGHYHKVTGEWTWDVVKGKLIFERLREHWGTFRAVAHGEADVRTLPRWEKEKPSSESHTPTAFDDENPF
jgi:hypothetical protein